MTCTTESPGIADVVSWGGGTKQYQVNVDPSRLRGYNLTLKQVFDAVAANSMDASSDRDFLMEFVFDLSLIAVHLSGWAEEWVIWSTTEFSFLDLPDAFCTGSSIMPHKKNPDVLELIRGKTARVAGDLQRLLMRVKEHRYYGVPWPVADYDSCRTGLDS